MSNMQRSNHLSLVKVLISLFMTILLWSLVTNAWGYTELFGGAQGDSLITHAYDFFSRFVWALPVIALLQRYKDEIPTTWKKLFTNKPHFKPMIIAVAIIILYHFGAMLFNHGGLWVNPDFNFLLFFPTFLMVAFAEELVYRGWGFNALSAFLPERTANIVSNLFFVLLHLPAYFIKYYLDGSFPVAAVISQCIMVFILGLLFGYLYRKGKSLWSPMIVHFLADLLSVIMLG